jgi:PAS domain S-box-containing protein
MKREGARRPLAGRSVAFKVAIIYAFVGGLWILLSDNVVAALAPDLEALLRMQLYKGWFFIAASSVLLYLLIHRQMRPMLRFQERLRESEAKYQRILNSAKDAIVLVDLDEGTIADLNTRAAEILARPIPRLIGKPIKALFPPGEGDAYLALLDDIAGGRSSAEQIELYNEKERKEQPVEVTASAFEIDGRRMMQGTFREIAEPEQAGRRALEEVDELREEARRARFLAETSSILVGTLEYETTLQNITSLAVPALADWCVLDVTQADGSVRRGAGAHRDPKMQETVAGLLAYAPDPQHPQQVLQAIRNEESVLHTDVSEEWMKSLAHDSEEQRLLQELGAVDLLTVPLVTHGRVVGALTLALCEHERRFDTTHVELARAFARHAAYAIDNANRLRNLQASARRDADFLASMADDFRAPLNDLVSYANLLEREIAEGATPAQRQELENLLDSARELLRLSADARAYAAREGEGTVQVELLDLVEVAREAAALVEPAAADRAVRLRLSTPEGPVIAETDPAKLREVLVDLLGRGVQTATEELVLHLAITDGAAVFEVRGAGGETDVDARREGKDSSIVEEAAPQPPGELDLGSTGKLVDLLGASLKSTTEADEGPVFSLRLPLASPPSRTPSDAGRPG